MKNYKFISELIIDDDARIRQIEESDVKNYYILLDKNRNHLKKWMAWAEATTEATVLEFVKKSCEYNKSGTRILEGVESICDCLILYNDKIIGIVGLLAGSKKGEVGIGYWLDEDYNGKGIITRTVKKVANYCLTALEFNSVFLAINIKNKKSQAVAERIGKYYKKELIEKDKNRGGEDQFYYYFK